MAFEEADRVEIRKYLGFAAIFQAADPRLESAISAVQSRADGGSRPDNTSEQLVRKLLAKLARLEQLCEDIWGCFSAAEIGNIKVDNVRKLYALRSEGRRVVHALANVFSTHPVSDFWGPAPIRGDGEESLTRSYAAQAWRSV